MEADTELEDCYGNVYLNEQRKHGKIECSICASLCWEKDINKCPWCGEDVCDDCWEGHAGRDGGL